MRIIAIGRLRPGPEADLFARYAARIRPALAVTELAEATGAAAEVKRRDSIALIEALAPGAFAVALDHGGHAPTSEAFAALLAGWQDAGHKPAFLIGGAEGLGAAVIARANYVLSLGALTWPHMLVRAMLAEQIYRAQAINAGHPYHRGGRP
jgi:23S rRNA (pseudouridine1915-N3)-methyltransferase